MSTNTNNKVSIVQKIESVSPAQVASIPEVADRFKSIYKIMNGGNEERAAVKYEAEKFHFMKLIQDKPELQRCTKISLYGCFLDMAVNGLSFDASMKHAYVVSFNTNVGTKQVPKWEARAQLMISGYGELHMRVRQGQIKYADNPQLVYDGDEFRYGTKDGKPFLDHVAVVPRKSDDIIACYLRIERMDGSVDYKVISMEEVIKLKAFSKQPNSLAWTSGLPGMIQAKTIKHAFRSYPKMRMGEFSAAESLIVDADHEQVAAIDYGLNGHMPKNAPPAAHEINNPDHSGQQDAQALPDDDSFTQNTNPDPGTVSFDDDDF